MRHAQHQIFEVKPGSGQGAVAATESKCSTGKRLVVVVYASSKKAISLRRSVGTKHVLRDHSVALTAAGSGMPVGIAHTSTNKYSMRVYK